MLRCILLSAICVMLPLGCATAAGPQPALNHEVPPVGVDQVDQEDADGTARDPGAPDIVARGSSQWSRSGQTISLHFTNRRRVPVQLRYLADEYLARTRSGRVLVLEKDFLTYPDRVSPGTEASVTLRFPNAEPAADITYLIAMINDAQTVIILRPASRSAQEPLAPGQQRFHGASGSTPPPIAPSSGGVELAEQPPTLKVAGPEETALPARPAADPQMTETVPVVVEFTQEHGEALHVDIRWNEDPRVIRLLPGHEQTFQVVPNQHVLHLACQIQPLAPTRGRVPVVVQAGRPIRITLEGRARPYGAEVTARVQRGRRVVSEVHFTPDQGSR